MNEVFAKCFFQILALNKKHIGDETHKFISVAVNIEIRLQRLTGREKQIPMIVIVLTLLPNGYDFLYRFMLLRLGFGCIIFAAIGSLR